MTVRVSQLEFPVPPTGDATQPCMLVPSASIVRLYNQVHSGKEFKNVNKRIKSWFKEAARQSGWTQVKFYLELDAPRSLGALLIYKTSPPQSPDPDFEIRTPNPEP